MTTPADKKQRSSITSEGSGPAVLTDDSASVESSAQAPAKSAAESGAKLYKYHDYADAKEEEGLTAEEAPSPPTASRGATESSIRVQKFPVKLYAILAQKEFHDIITWMPHGRSWKVLKPSMFESLVMPLFFEYSNYHSFNRLVNAWSFRRISTGPDRGSYYHELFLRGKPHLQKYMRRLPKTHKKLPMKKGDEPDFYKMDKENPLPNLEDAPIPGVASLNVAAQQPPAGLSQLPPQAVSVPHHARGATGLLAPSTGRLMAGAADPRDPHVISPNQRDLHQQQLAAAGLGGAGALAPGRIAPGAAAPFIPPPHPHPAGPMFTMAAAGAPVDASTGAPIAQGPVGGFEDFGAPAPGRAVMPPPASAAAMTPPLYGAAAAGALPPHAGMRPGLMRQAQAPGSAMLTPGAEHAHYSGAMAAAAGAPQPHHAMSRHPSMLADPAGSAGADPYALHFHQQQAAAAVQQQHQMHFQQQMRMYGQQPQHHMAAHPGSAAGLTPEEYAMMRHTTASAPQHRF